MTSVLPLVGKTLVRCLLLLVATACAYGQTHSSSPAGRIEIPFRAVEGVVWLDVRVNGSAPLKFMLDTAASNDVIARDRAEELKLELTEVGEAHAGTGDQTAHLATARNVELRIGNAHYVNPQVTVIPFDAVNRAFGDRIDGLLGYGFLSRWVVSIDYARNKLILNPNGGYQYQGFGRILPLRSSGGEPIVTASVVLDDQEFAGDFLVDAPYRRALALTTPFLRKNGLLQAMRKSGRRLLPAELSGVGGKSQSWIGRLSAVKIGGFTSPQPIAHFAEALAGAFTRQDIAGIIGAQILRNFVVTFDYPRRRLILDPAAEPLADDTDMAGILWDAEPPTYQLFKVTRVQEDSPASEAGVRSGDTLVSLDGRPASMLRKWQLAEVLRRPGREVVMVLRRGDNPVTIKLKLRRLL